ncbi:MAG: alpha/beta fold hydrolase [Ferruginibacter sp.]
MRFFFVFLLISLSVRTINAQGKQFTMEEAMLRARNTLAPTTLKQLQFVKGTNDIVYLKSSNATDAWVRTKAQSPDKITWLLALPALNQRLRKAGLDTVKQLPAAQFHKAFFTAVVNEQKLRFDWNKDEVSVLVSKEAMSNEYLEENGAGYVSYVKDNNLFLQRGNQVWPVTTDGSADIVYGSTVHQSEFGITKGTFWSPSGKRLAYYRMDQTMVPDYPIVNWSERPAKVENLRYPMAGELSHMVTLHVVDPETRKTWQILTSGPEDQYLTNVCWSPDERFIYIVIVNREQDHFCVNQYDAESGSFVKTLFEESDDKYAEPLVPMLFVNNHPELFVWQSRRDGWNHVYLYRTDGTLVRQLTKGNWEVTDVKGFDEKGEWLYVVSTVRSPISRNLQRISLSTGVAQNITEDDAMHVFTVSSSGELVIDQYSTPDNPRTIRVINTKNRKSNEWLRSPNPLASYALGDMRIFTISNQAGDELYCRLYKPVGFDSTQKYPVVVYWYGGPHAQMITNGWNGGAGDYWFQYMAQRGYVVFTIDTRGSAYRGKAFEQAIFRVAGEKQTEDLLQAVAYLKAQSYVDASRMGLFGWSYGGFMTTYFMLHHPDIFKAAVAGGPVIDWKFYEIMYTERYMDKPEENPAGYQATDLSRMIDQLNGKLLLIHGMQDNVVLMQHSVNLVRAAVSKNKQVDYMIYPGHEHNVVGKDRAHLYQKVTDYLQQHLVP